MPEKKPKGYYTFFTRVIDAIVDNLGRFLYGKDTYALVKKYKQNNDLNEQALDKPNTLWMIWFGLWLLLLFCEIVDFDYLKGLVPHFKKPSVPQSELRNILGYVGAVFFLLIGRYGIIRDVCKTKLLPATRGILFNGKIVEKSQVYRAVYSKNLFWKVTFQYIDLDGATITHFDEFTHPKEFVFLEKIKSGMDAFILVDPILDKCSVIVVPPVTSWHCLSITRSQELARLKKHE